MLVAVKEKKCFECREPINPNRIKALPNCTTCIKCQENNDIPVPRERPTDMARLSRCSISDFNNIDWMNEHE